jgi:hypothetical protein
MPRLCETVHSTHSPPSDSTRAGAVRHLRGARVRIPAVHEDHVIASGMSGSPVLAMDGTAIGIVSARDMSPSLLRHLPGWYLDSDPAGVWDEPDPV